MNHIRLLPVLALLLLSACSKPPALTLPEDKQVLIGVWEYQGSDPDQGIIRNEMLLVFHPDSTVSYKRCLEKKNGHSYTTLPNARIIEISNDEIVIALDFWLSDMKRNLMINSWPYLKDGHWQMNINGLLLKKLNEGEKSQHRQWSCEDQQTPPANNSQDIRF